MVNRFQTRIKNNSIQAANQSEISKTNQKAWNSKAYEAWSIKYGDPATVAKSLAKAPEEKPRRFLPHLGEVHGKKIANPLGSNGRLAVSLALLGAEMTVFDISESNRRYATEVAHHARVKIDYVADDFAQQSGYISTFDAILLELGVLHYFLDLWMLMSKIEQMLKPGGMLIINEFHPLLTKALNMQNGEVSVIGDYFGEKIETVDVAYQSIVSETSLPSCQVRRWTLGEIVTSVARCGLGIDELHELPGWSTNTLPQMFTLVATKPIVHKGGKSNANNANPIGSCSKLS